MNALLKKAIQAGIALPASCLMMMKRYESLASIRSQPAPRVLVIACHWIGDTLWAAQVVPALRNLWPDGHLACITKPVCASIWSGELAVDQPIESTAVVSDRRRETTDWPALRRLGRELREGAWDMVIDLTGNRYSALLSHWTGARHTLGFDGGELGALYATRVVNAQRPGRHLSERPFRVLEPLLGEFAYPKGIQAPPPGESYASACARYGLHPDEPVVVVAPGAGWKGKEWGEARYARLGQILAAVGCQLFFTGSPDQRLLCQSVRPPEGRGAAISTDPVERILPVLSGAAAFAGNDSGLAHLAAAYGIPTHAIFTRHTRPEEYRPLGARVTVLHADAPETAPETLAQAILAQMPPASGVSENRGRSAS